MKIEQNKTYRIKQNISERLDTKQRKEEQNYRRRQKVEQHKDRNKTKPKK